MYEKCIVCNRIGESCVPNLMRLPFHDLIQWCHKRQKHLEWTNQHLADVSNVPVGTINRIKAGDYLDCRYSTMRSIVIALIGGTTDEFPCNMQVEELEKQAAKLASIEKENEALKNRLEHIDELHRNDIRAVKAEYQEQKKEYMERIDFLKEQLKVWQSR